MKNFFIGTIIVFALTIASPAHAEVKSTFLGPIVPEVCNCKDQTGPNGQSIQTAPDYGCVLQTVQNSVNFGVTFSTILFTLYIVIAALQFITRGDSSEARTKARTRLINVFVGLVVLLTSWLIVDYVMKNLYNSNVTSDGKEFGPWNSILAGNSDKTDRCIVANNSQSVLFTGSITPNVTVVPGSTGGSTGTISAASFDVAGSKNPKICNAASSYSGANTSSGPSDGRLACAWAVNNVLSSAGYSSIGGNAVSGMESALQKGRGNRIAQSQATCGDIVIEAGDSHVGICMNTGCTQVISNSSSKATYSWVSSISFEPSYHSGNGRIYHVNN